MSHATMNSTFLLATYEVRYSYRALSGISLVSIRMTA